MPELSQVDAASLKAAEPELRKQYAQYREQSLSLDMTRGKPCREQLDLSLELLTNLGQQDYRSADGTDARNYGVLDGLPEAKRLFSEFLEVGPDEICIGGNSSLQLMHQCVSMAMLHGVPGGSGPWTAGGLVRFLCPAPGYDRHFGICEHLGIEMIAVEMKEQGPDMGEIERRLAEDPSIKGLWIVPKHANPTGATLSAEVVQRFAKLKAAPDFRLLWDNAYSVHHLTDSPPELEDILAACKRAGNPDRVLLFGSTSKISFAGAGVSAVGGSAANMAWLRGHLSKMTIGSDKLNQLRHVRFFRDAAGIAAHMRRHAAILRPKFEAVQRKLEAQLAPARLATWTRPTGGYFVSLDTADGCAARVVQLAKDAGVKLTAAGATFPYGKDPRDRNIRIAPTLPPTSELELAMDVLCTCVKLATLERLG